MTIIGLMSTPTNQFYITFSRQYVAFLSTNRDNLLHFYLLFEKACCSYILFYLIVFKEQMYLITFFQTTILFYRKTHTLSCKSKYIWSCSSFTLFCEYRHTLIGLSASKGATKISHLPGRQCYVRRRHSQLSLLRRGTQC